MKKAVIFGITAIGAALWLFVMFEIFYIHPTEYKYSEDVFEDYLRNELRQVPVSSIAEIRIYSCSRNGWWALERLEKRYGPPVVATIPDDIEKIIEELHYPGDGALYNSRGRSDIFHLVIKTEAEELGYARILRNKEHWWVKGNNTIWVIDEPSYLVSPEKERSDWSD